MNNDVYDAAIEYCGGNKGSDARVRTAFVMGAEWQEERLINKACEWLKGVLYVEERYSPDGNFVESDARSVEEFINEFRKAMEDEK